MVKYIIGAVTAILLLFIWGFFTKKKYYREIDRIEAWKIDIMNRPVLDELSKVKQLNMTGETEEMFERWRNEWDAIVTVYLPDVEELLFDAEEYVDKYRFKRSKEIQNRIEVKLKEIEEYIAKILEELHELVGSEENNRIEIEELKGNNRNVKKSLLAHRHSYGKAAVKLEVLLDEVQEILNQFEQETDNGNYLNARKLVLIIKSKLAAIEAKMELIPQLLIEINSSIPAQLAELKEGYQEMVNQGFALTHIQFEKEYKQLEENLFQYKEYLEQAEVEEADRGLQEINDAVDVLYDLLEKEVMSKQYLQKNKNSLKDEVLGIEYENDKLKLVTASVLHTYHLSENELEAQRKLDKQIIQLAKRHQALQVKISENVIAHSDLREEMDQVDTLLKQLKTEHQAFSEKLQALRKDEMEAQEKLIDLKRKMSETQRLVEKSNFPGLPEEYKSFIIAAKESIAEVQGKLEEKPLDMSSVQICLGKAVEAVDTLFETTNDLIEQMYLAEKVIQYGNRYRSKYTSIAEALLEAEECFRKYEYESALEIAASAIEKVEPGSLKKIELDLEKVR